MVTNSAWLCTPSARSTHTITYMMQHHSKPFWRGFLVPTGWGSSMTLLPPAQEWRIPWPTWWHSFAQWWMVGTLTQSTHNSCTAPPLLANCQSRNANHADTTGRRINVPSHTAKREEKEEGQQQRACEEHLPPLQEIPTQEAPSCWPRQMHVEQENTKDTISNSSATSSRWRSSHATNLRRNWVGMRTKRIK